MIVGSVILIVLGMSFSTVYSGYFIRPIEAIHNGADAIAKEEFIRDEQRNDGYNHGQLNVSMPCYVIRKDKNGDGNGQ